MSGHTKWSEIKHKRDRPSVLWTGDNVTEVEDFAVKNDFGFIVGSPRGRQKRRHKFFERLSYPREDKKILEIYPNRDDKTKLEQFLESRTTEDLNTLLINLEPVLILAHPSLLDRVRELVDAIESERDTEYVPWHWTDAKPGDRIFGDGTVLRGNDEYRYIEKLLSPVIALFRRNR